MALMFIFGAFAAKAQDQVPARQQSTQKAQRLALRAQEEITAGKISAAHRLLLNGVKSLPQDPALWDLLGATEAEEDHPTKAKQDFQRAISLDSHYAAAYLNLGHLEEIESAHDPQSLTSALETYRMLLRFDPKNIDGLFQYALVALEKGLFSDSLSHLNQIPETQLQRVRAQAILCADLAATGHKNRAKIATTSILANPDLSESDLLPAVGALADHHRSAFAILLLKGLQQRGLASPKSLEELGLLEESAGKFKEARSALGEAARARPGDVHLLMHLADVAYKGHDYKGALSYLAHARDLKPRNASIHFFFGMICVELNLHVEAYDSLKKAVALDPGNAYYNYALGAVSIDQNDTEGAIACFKKYCHLKPHDLHGRLALGVAYYYAQKLGQARSILSLLVKNPITAMAANYYLGRIAVDQGHYAAAISYLRQAIRDKPHYANAYAVLGKVYLNEKNYSASSRALHRALAIEPDNYLANLNLTILYFRTKDVRAAAQKKRLAKVRKEREERAKLFLRKIRVVR